MGFASGPVSFRRFAVTGQAAPAVDQTLLDKLFAHALAPTELGVPEEVEYGWCGGRHLFDATFTFEHNVFADAVHFALRIDTNKVPGDIKKAYALMEEEATAAGNPSGFISKLQKKEVKDSVRKKVEEELRTGKFRRSKLVPILWDVPSGMLYSSASGTALEKLHEIFERTFGLTLQPLSAGSLALRFLEPLAKRRDYEDARPTRFVPGPDGEGQYPEYPWVAKGPEPKDFLGNEFLLWLWHEADHKTGIIPTEAVGDVTIYFDRSLDLDCAYAQTGKDTLRGDGPSRMPEAKDALRTGKLPRKAGLTLHNRGQQYDFTLNPESFTIAAGKLPEVEDADTPRTLFEERITLLRDFCEMIDALFETFLKVRASSAWEGQTGGIRKWILSAPKAGAAAA